MCTIEYVGYGQVAANTRVWRRASTIIYPAIHVYIMMSI